MQPFWQWWAMFVFLWRFYSREMDTSLSYSEILIGFLCFHFASYYWVGFPIAEKMQLSLPIALIPGLLVAMFHTLLFLLCIKLRRDFLAGFSTENVEAPQNSRDCYLATQPLAQLSNKVLAAASFLTVREMVF